MDRSQPSRWRASVSGALCLALAPAAQAALNAARVSPAALERYSPPASIVSCPGICLSPTIAGNPFSGAGLPGAAEGAHQFAQAGSPASDAASGTARSAVAPDAAAAAERKWGLAPIRWRGVITTELRKARAGATARRTQFMQIANFVADSYVWQPWFAQVQGGLGVVASQERAGDDASDSSARAKSKALTGSGTLSLFPASRFPFLARVESSDSRASDEITASEFTTWKLGLRQTYRDESGNKSYAATYDRNTLTGAQFGRDTVDVLTGSMSRRMEDQSLFVNGDWSRNRRGASGDGSEIRRVGARHGYSDPDALFNVESTASFSDSRMRLFSGTGGLEDRLNFLQLNSFGTWRPEEDHPLFVTGGARYYESRNRGVVNSETQSLGANAAARYTFDRNLNAFASGTVANSRSQGTPNGLVTTQGAGINYVADPIRFGEFIYVANSGAAFGNQTGPQGGRHNLTGQAGHGVTRAYTITPEQSVSLNLNQSYGTAVDSVAAASRSIGHGASIAWRMIADQSMTAFSAISMGDSRSYGQSPSVFQLANFQASGQVPTGRYSLATANLTVQRTRQELPQLPAASGENTLINGGFSIQNTRVFGIRRLRYLATYTRNDVQFNSRLQGDPNAPRERVSQLFDQRLDYSVGRLDVRLSLRLAEIDGRKNALLFLRISRQL